MIISDELNSVLRCPKCSGESFESIQFSLKCQNCLAKYKVEDGILNISGYDQANKVIVDELKDWEKNAVFYLREENSPLFKLLSYYKIKTFGISQLKKDQKILDFGGGAGYFSGLLKEQEQRVVTLDLSSEMLRIGIKCHALDNVVQAVVPPLPFKNSCFDIVIANGLFHHLKAQGVLQTSLVEINRILKPNGLLLMYDRNGAFWGRHIHHFVMFIRNKAEEKWRFSSSSSSHEPDFNDDDISKIIRAGFKIEKRRFVSTIFTFICIVVTNTVGYLGLPGVASILRWALWPFLALSELMFPFKSFTVEQCVRFRKT